ncbi:sulfite exporter TauE/SafE family protein, partial [Escherichia coli]|nr:sulfite exporter TauE/SafE family protein [Escherichia coli]
FVGFSATQMLLAKKPAPARQMPGMAGQWVAGGGIGFVSGLVGAGGGFVSVPFMTWCNVAMHNAVATSAALGFPIALANT